MLAGKAAPVAVRVYQLTATAKFERGDVFALTEHEQQTLGQDDAGSQEFVLSPGETQTKTFELKPGVQAIGVVVLYRDIDSAQWRADAPVATSGPTKLTLQRRQTCYHAEARLHDPAGCIDATIGGNRPMSWTNRVVWQEGMFLRTQHFQQQDRWTEQLVRGRVQALRPHPWGLVDYALDRDLLGTGRFALASATGVFEDGTPFALPGETDHPAPLELPESARNVAGLSGAADPPGRRGRGGRQRHRGPLRRAPVRGLRHALRFAAAGASCRSGGCACATCSRPTSAPAICASAWRA